MTRYLLGDLVRNCKEKVDRDNNPYEYFVAGDHMETERPRLTMRGRFDAADVGPAFIRLFRPGQVLHGSRRTYLKKVSVADFEGVTSNVTFVLETKDEEVLPQRLLPFLLLSDRFTSYSIGKSKGSTNPYVLFSDLADFEVDLPGPARVAEIADVMCAAEQVKENYRNLLAACDDVVKSQFVEMFGDPDNDPSNFSVETVKDAVLSISDGPFGSNLKSSHYVESDVRVLRLGNIKSGFFDDADKAFITESHYETLKRYTCKPGDVIVGTLGEPNLRACIVPDYVPVSINKSDCVHITLNQDKLLARYVCTYFNLESTLRIAKKDMHGNTRSRITMSQVSALPISVPPLELQQEFADFAAQIDKSKFKSGTCGAMPSRYVDLPWRTAA